MLKSYLFTPIVYIMFTFAFLAVPTSGQESNRETLIKFETSRGNMVVKLYNETPAHRDNMIKLINEGFYKDQLFHRVIKDFMIQGVILIPQVPKKVSVSDQEVLVIQFRLNSMKT